MRFFLWMFSFGHNDWGGFLYTIEYCCINTIGKVRESNQDNFYCEGRYRYGSEKFNDISLSGKISSSSDSILAVFDGMGGEACGDMASLVSAAGAGAFDGRQGNGKEILCDMSRNLNSLVCAYAESNGVSTMGTTLAAVRFSDSSAAFVNLGDSRIFSLGKDGIVQLSRDHTVPNYYKPKAPLTQFLGLPEKEYILEPYITELVPREGDMFLLCSDGITDMVKTEEIKAVVSEGADVRSACAMLVNKALENGGYDNITAVICKISEDPTETIDKKI